MNIENMAPEEIDHHLLWWAIGDMMNWLTSLSTIEKILIFFFLFVGFMIFIKSIFLIGTFIFSGIKNYLKDIKDNFNEGLK